MSQDNRKRIKQKQLVNKFIDRPVEFLIRHNFSPNSLSYLGFFCSLGAALLIALGFIHFFFWFAWLVPFLLFWAGAFDVFDGEVARRTDNNTKSGAFLDSNLDRLSDALLVLGLIYGGFIHFLLGYIILFLIIMISYLRARAENEGINMKGIGLMERAERLIMLFIALILEIGFYYFSELITGKHWTIYNPIISSKPITWFFLFFILVYIFLLFLTVAHRLLYTYESLKNSDNNKK